MGGGLWEEGFDGEGGGRVGVEGVEGVEVGEEEGREEVKLGVE